MFFISLLQPVEYVCVSTILGRNNHHLTWTSRVFRLPTEFRALGLATGSLPTFCLD